MTSILKVTEIQDPTNSNSALTIDSSGTITTPSGFANSATATFSSASNVIQLTSNGIPSWANEITLSFRGVSWTSNSNNLLFRAYVGGSVVTANYVYTSHYNTTDSITISDRTAGNDGGFSFYGWDSAANEMNGTVTFNHVQNYTYIVNGFSTTHTAPAYLNRFSGTITLSGPISGVDMTNGSNFDAGTARVIWR